MRVEVITQEQAQDLQDYFGIEDRDQCFAFIAQEYGVYYVVPEEGSEIEVNK